MQNIAEGVNTLPMTEQEVIVKGRGGEGEKLDVDMCLWIAINGKKCRPSTEVELVCPLNLERGHGPAFTGWQKTGKNGTNTVWKGKEGSGRRGGRCLALPAEERQRFFLNVGWGGKTPREKEGECEKPRTRKKRRS